ncbi:MAG: class I SAM-dependent methyltransferase [Gammaproteobacteria bacterium]|jgi:demethylmenaquinone methyltransferase/2-methoxy-6-polyprenyl-1,4-benzoquinol methylase|nr:MAG: class I SAM-dependent methyltransferase [Gammaproteobacteria bacterium]
MVNPGTTDFGYRQVSPAEKTRRVREVFSSVSGRYDLMNDLMSLGAHRLWKRYAVHIAPLRRNARVLDVAGGTGDMTVLLRKRLGPEGRIVLSDVNEEMLRVGRDRLLNRGITRGVEYVLADAEALPFQDNAFDGIVIAFGLRNVTDKQRALQSMHDKLAFGGALLILEFSTVVLPLLARLYDRYSFELIPRLGSLIAGDRGSYEYLVESIRRHPDQQTLKAMMEQAGFSRVDVHNLSGGIVAIHRGYKL